MTGSLLELFGNQICGMDPVYQKFLDAAVLSEDLRPLKGSLIDRVWLAHHLAMAMGFYHYRPWLLLIMKKIVTR